MKTSPSEIAVTQDLVLPVRCITRVSLKKQVWVFKLLIYETVYQLQRFYFMLAFTLKI